MSKPLKSADAICRPFVQSFMALSASRKSDALVQYALDSFENFAAEPVWWGGLPEEARDELKFSSPNGTDMSFGLDSAALIPSSTSYADWEVDS